MSLNNPSVGELGLPVVVAEFEKVTVPVPAVIFKYFSVPSVTSASAAPPVPAEYVAVNVEGYRKTITPDPPAPVVP